MHSHHANSYPSHSPANTNNTELFEEMATAAGEVFGFSDITKSCSQYITALAFCYFETLMRIGDKQKFSHEEVRLKSMSRMITDLGHDEHLFEDFVDNTLDCLQQCAVATDNGAQLLRVFNDSTPMNQWQGIIAHLKV